MSWSNLGRVLRRWFISPASESEETIDEELLFHLRLLIDDNLAKGMPTDAAWHEAQIRFGSFRRYADECRRVFSRGHQLSQRLSAVGLLVLSVLLGWVVIEVRALRQAQLHAPAENRPVSEQREGEASCSQRAG